MCNVCTPDSDFSLFFSFLPPGLLVWLSLTAGGPTATVPGCHRAARVWFAWYGRWLTLVSSIQTISSTPTSPPFPWKLFLQSRRTFCAPWLETVSHSHMDQVASWSWNKPSHPPIDPWPNQSVPPLLPAHMRTLHVEMKQVASRDPHAWTGVWSITKIFNFSDLRRRADVRKCALWC